MTRCGDPSNHFLQPSIPMDAPIIIIDDKHVPLYRIVWVSDLPHFCGDDECEREGEYEVRLEADESLWTNMQGRDKVIEALAKWCGDPSDSGEGEF